MKRIAPILITSLVISLVIIVAGAASPSSNDRDLIIRLQGEVLVLQRQTRDLQESLDRHHETMNSTLQRVAEQSGEATKTLSPIASKLNQAGALQLHSVEGLERRINELSTSSRSDFKSLSEELREIKSLLAKPASQR